MDHCYHVYRLLQGLVIDQLASLLLLLCFDERLAATSCRFVVYCFLCLILLINEDFYKFVFVLDQNWTASIRDLTIRVILFFHTLNMLKVAAVLIRHCRDCTYPTHALLRTLLLLLALPFAIRIRSTEGTTV